MPFTPESAAAARRKHVKTAAKSTIDSRYDPLGYCPPDRRLQLAKRGQKAKRGSLAAMVELACIHCMGFQPNLVPDCTDPKCPLWARATRRNSR